MSIRGILGAVVLLAAAPAAVGQSTGSGDYYDPWASYWANRGAAAWARVYAGEQPTRQYMRALYDAKNPTVSVHELYGWEPKRSHENRGTGVVHAFDDRTPWRRQLVLDAVDRGEKPKPAAVFCNPTPRD